MNCVSTRRGGGRPTPTHLRSGFTPTRVYMPCKSYRDTESRGSRCLPVQYAALWKVIKSNSPELATCERSRRCPKAKAPRLPGRVSIFTSQTFIAPIEYDFVIEGNRSRDRYRKLIDTKYVAPASVDSRHRYFHILTRLSADVFNKYKL